MNRNILKKDTQIATISIDFIRTFSASLIIRKCKLKEQWEITSQAHIQNIYFYLLTFLLLKLINGENLDLFN